MAQPEEPTTTEPSITDSIRTGLDAAVKSIGEMMGADPNAQMPEADIEQTPEDRLNEMDPAGRAVAGAITGGMQAVFETKDFLFGDTPREEQSPARSALTAANDAAKGSGIIGGLSSGIGQFTVAMMGLGKLGIAARALPWVGQGAAAVEGLKGGSAALEAGKAALAGAIAFDPHEERLSNLIQDTPLANPFNAWLAADPEDTAAMGRLKSAMESLGMDAVIIGTFSGGLKVWKYLKQGKTAEASRAVGQLEAEQRAAFTEVEDGKLPTDAEAGTAEALPEGAAAGSAGADGEAVLTGGREVPSDVPVNVSEAPETKALAQDPEVDVEVTANPTAALEEAGVAKPKAFKPKVDFSPDEATTILDDIPLSLENAEKDWDAMAKHGDWSGAVESGARLTPDMGNFYERFKTDNEVDQFIELAVNHKAEELEAQGFRVRLTDEKLQRQVRAFAELAGTDPAGLLGILQQAGEASRTLTAKMVVVGSLTAKTFQDASLLAMRRKLGDYSQFGSLEAMEAEIAKRFSLATSLLKITDEIRSQGGRTLRANRGKPFDPSMFEGIGKDRFYDLLAEAQGDPKKLKMLADPTLYRKIMDTVNYMRISSLVSGPKTQLINMITNGYMVGVRPLERILGSIPGAAAGSASSRLMIKQNLMQYTYMGSAFRDGFSQAVKAFTRNDGLLRPHGHDVYGVTGSGSWQVPGTQAMGKNFFKPWDSFGNVFYNALSIPLAAAGTSTRTLGSVDELVKQTVYRSKVASMAHMEAVEQALEAGLKGKAYKDFIKSFVSKRLDNAFDAEGRGVDPDALREANISTFQQDLLPGTFGKNIQTAISNDKTQLTKLILPFVKTPTNVIRYGWKMTPGLNLLQTEYKQMLSGALGAEAKAQAIGQMSMGSLFMGSAAFMAAQGMLTGGGPSDPKLKAQMLATGWQPYSIVVEHDDGTKSYIPFNRYDPVALPFGIIADIQDGLSILGDDAAESPEVEAAIGALLVSLSKQFTSRTYLMSLNQALDALNDPERNGKRFIGGVAQSFVPFSAATRQLSSDPYLRDARQVTDMMLQAIPGMSKDLPPRYNWLGQPILNRQGLWTDDNGTLVDAEVIRLGLEGSTSLSAPSPVWNGVDLREITTVDGENAYTAYQRLAGQPSKNARSLRDTVAKVMRSGSYQRAPDGDAQTRGTKTWLLLGVVSKYREAASKRIRADKNVREALMAAQRRVVDHYKHLKQPPTAEQTDSVQQVIQSFGAGN